MTLRTNREKRVFELMLVAVTIGMTYLLYRLGVHRLVALNLFFLPIVLAGYYLGRTAAGVLALFSALAVTVVITLDATGFASYTTPVMMGLALTIWAAVLGLTAILVGTLCDEREGTVKELQDAYVGVVEVVTKYLQGADPKRKPSSIRAAELSQAVAQQMKLSRKQMDDIRVGSLLYDLGDVEVTTQVLNKAVTSLETGSSQAQKHTFLGQDLAQSLGSVLSGAVALLADHDSLADAGETTEGGEPHVEPPIGARIIQAVRAYDALTADDAGQPLATPAEAMSELFRDSATGYDSDVLVVMERVVVSGAHRRTLETLSIG